MSVITPQLTPAFVKATFNQDLHATVGNDFAIFGDILQIVQPKSILEAGFFKGGSACLLLHLSAANVTSVDPMKDPSGGVHEGSVGNATILSQLFPGRFTFIQKSSSHVRPDLAGQSFDLFNIDGDHLEAGIINDFELARWLNIPWLIVDDFGDKVADVYMARFASDYFPVKIYHRDDHHQGKPILRVLMRRKDPAIGAVPHVMMVKTT